MYLTRINEKTGLVDVGDINDGVLSILPWRKLIEAKGFGLECFTCVALTADYMTPIRNYAFQERHKRAMRNVMGNSDIFPWANELIQNALLAYSELQYVDDLEELKELQEMRRSKFEQVRKEQDEVRKIQLLQELQKLKRLINEFEKGIDQAALLDLAPSKGDYNLKRLEQKLSNKKSFYHEQKSESRLAGRSQGTGDPPPERTGGGLDDSGAGSSDQRKKGKKAGSKPKYKRRTAGSKAKK